jgi:hypothetical protein
VTIWFSVAKRELPCGPSQNNPCHIAIHACVPLPLHMARVSNLRNTRYPLNTYNFSFSVIQLLDLSKQYPWNTHDVDSSSFILIECVRSFPESWRPFLPLFGPTQSCTNMQI